MIVFILAIGASPDEMSRYAVFNLGFHCLPQYPFRRFQYTKAKWYGVVIGRDKHNIWGEWGGRLFS